MTEPCTIEILRTARETLRAEAIAVGQTLNSAKLGGVKMRVVRGLEIAHSAAWQRVYAVENHIYDLEHA